MYDWNLIFFDKNMVNLWKFSGTYLGKVSVPFTECLPNSGPWYLDVPLLLSNVVRDFNSAFIISFRLSLLLPYQHLDFCYHRAHFYEKYALDFAICNLSGEETASSRSGVPRPTARTSCFSKGMCIFRFEEWFNRIIYTLNSVWSNCDFTKKVP